MSKKKVLQEGFASSKAADPAIQRLLLDNLVSIASDPTHENWRFAMETLIKHGAFKLPEEKIDPNHEDEMPVEEAVKVVNEWVKKNG